MRTSLDNQFNAGADGLGEGAGASNQFGIPRGTRTFVDAINTGGTYGSQPERSFRNPIGALERSPATGSRAGWQTVQRGQGLRLTRLLGFPLVGLLLGFGDLVRHQRFLYGGGRPDG